ncbi:MAG: PKD domain-containing protein [Bacteroidetes bacterium]|nr:PKD domain-containing protein [Bacteroidota bacterium]
MKKQILFLTLLAGFSVEASGQCTASFNAGQTQNNVVNFTNTSTPVNPNTTYFWWNFGDNTPGDFSVNPSHTYSAPGNYPVTLSMLDSASQCLSIVTDTIAVTGNVICNVVVFSMPVSDASCATCADGVLSATALGGTAPYTYAWSNGDTGSTVSGLLPGQYVVCATDANGCSSCDTAYVAVQTQSSCNASFTTTLNAGNVYSFTNTSTSSPTAGYYWDFGDGNTSSLASPTHSYALSGNYAICLFVYDSAAMCFDLACDTLMNVIGNNPSSCNADFYIVYDTLQSSPMAWVINLSTASPSATFIWSWGDNTYDTTAFPSHVYAQPGTYTICLSIIDQAGNCYDTLCQSLIVFRLAQQAASSPFVVNVVSSVPTGIEAVETDTWSLYPVPASEVLHIRSSETLTGRRFRIVDLSGRMVESGVLTSSQLTVDALEKGVYLLQLESSGGNFSTQRFLRQ